MPETKQKSPVFFKSLNSFARSRHETLWLVTGFLPADDRRRALLVLRLDGEFHRIVTEVKEPLIAQIRLQWWRDEAENIQKGHATQQTEPALALQALIRQFSISVEDICKLIDAYDDIVTSSPSDYGPALFGLLTASQDDWVRALGRYFQSANAGNPDEVSQRTLFSALEHVTDAQWPWLCILEFASDWRTKTRSGPLTSRWRYWTAFVAGEKRLARKLRISPSSF